MANYEPRGITVRDVAAADFIKAYAEHLKNTGRVELPSWCDLVKTAPHKEMCPYDQDWYYIRAGTHVLYLALERLDCVFIDLDIRSRQFVVGWG